MILDLNTLERATLLALVGLAVAVMQNDEENGREFIDALSQPGIREVCQELVERLNAEVSNA